MDSPFRNRSLQLLRIGILLAALILLVTGILLGDATLIRIESATL